MSIDGIGKGGGVGPAATAVPTGPAQRPFEVGATQAPAGAEAAGRSIASGALEALERGEISVEQYLDARVESAVAPLHSKLSAEQLDFVRGELRTALESDPVLVELVRRTTSGIASGG